MKSETIEKASSSEGRKVARLLTVFAALGLFIVLTHSFSDAADADPQSSQTIMDLDLEDLMQIEVTSVSKKQETIKGAAAAIYVITADDIRHSTARHIPELLRMVPGLHVGQIDANRWEVSARGSGGQFSNKLLVLMDGRTVYTPIFSGVFWDAQDTALEDIERIEVIRGPGASLWGSNAVNGIINIITKSAKDTASTFISAGGGNEDHGLVTMRSGTQVGENAWFRGYGKFNNTDNSTTINGGSSYDEAQKGRGGFRFDVYDEESVENQQHGDTDSAAKDNRKQPPANPDSHFTLQGDVFANNEATRADIIDREQIAYKTLEQDGDLSGGNILGRFTKSIAGASELQLQAYYDRENRHELLIDSHIDTYDFDSQIRFPLAEGHEMTTGVNFRHVEDALEGKSGLQFNPVDRSRSYVGVFAQDEISLIPNSLKFILGTKFDHNEFTGGVWQPTTRLSWQINQRHSVWTAVSRAMRIPARSDNDVQLLAEIVPGPQPLATEFFGNRDLRAEELIAYEAGYRVEPSSRLLLDANFFVHSYDDVVTATPAALPTSDPRILPLLLTGSDRGDVYGTEIVLTWQALEDLRLQLWYDYLANELVADSPDPAHQASLRAIYNWSPTIGTSLQSRYVDNIPMYNVPSYIEADAKIWWRPLPAWEFSLSGINLLHDDHQEYAPQIFRIQETQAERAVLAKVMWTF